MQTLTKWVNILLIVYIAIPIIVALIIAVLYFLGKKITKEVLEKLLDFSKWYMVAVAIIFAAKIVDSSFTDRETSIKEIAVYEKYATNILESDNLEKRWKLSEYFAAVTPSRTLRERWEAYKELLKPQYDTLIAARKTRIELSAKDSLNEKEKKELLNSQQTISLSETPLISSPENEDQWIIVFTADVELDEAIFENENLIKAGVTDAIIVKKASLFYNVSKDYDFKKEASASLQNLRSKVRADAYVTVSDKFCSNKLKNGSYFICQ